MRCSYLREAKASGAHANAFLKRSKKRDGAITEYLEDLAAASGISRAQVPRALRGDRGVKSERRARIKKITDELG